MALSLAKEAKKKSSKTASKLAHEVIQERDKTFSRPSGTTKKKNDPINDLVKMAAAGFGLMSETFHYRREKKVLGGEGHFDQSQQSDDAYVPEQFNEAVWAIDDAEGQVLTQETDSQSPKEPTNLAKAFLKRHPCQPNVNSDTKLALPVILVQRRPNKRVRGFIRGYAPVLADVGIEQETFLDFIDTLNEVLKPNPWLYAINLAGLGGMAVPDPLMMLFGAGVGVATDAAMEAQSRFRSNKFLDRVNADLFIPQGLVCLVVTWKPDIGDAEIITAVDFDGKEVDAHPETSPIQMMKEIMTQKTSSEEGLRQTRKQMQRMMASYSGTVNLAEPAPLIFPSLHQGASAQGKYGDIKKKNVANRAETWLDEYMDRRAQAKWIEENSDLPMTDMLPKPGFRSRYADPNHPASSGDIVALLTGGRWKYGHAKYADSERGRDKTASERSGNDKTSKRTKVNNKSRSAKSSHSRTHMGGATSLLQKDVLYLVIVNLPSQ